MDRDFDFLAFLEGRTMLLRRALIGIRSESTGQAALEIAALEDVASEILNAVDSMILKESEAPAKEAPKNSNSELTPLSASKKVIH